MLLISGNVDPNPGPIRNNPRPRYPGSICHLDVGRDSLQCSACLKWVHFRCSSLTCADFRTICATGTAVGWLCLACCPQSQIGPPYSDDACVPSPRVAPTTTWLLTTASPSEPPRYPCSLCSHEVGKDSLKCSTCSKWVHFSCSSLTRVNFRKICAAGSTMGWNCPACLNGDLASPIHQQASLRPVSPVPPPPTPPTNIFRCNGFISTSPFPSSTLSVYLPHRYRQQVHNQSTTRRHTLNELHASLKTLELYDGMLAVFPPHVVLN